MCEAIEMKFRNHLEIEHLVYKPLKNEELIQIIELEVFEII